MHACVDSNYPYTHTLDSLPLVYDSGSEAYRYSLTHLCKSDRIKYMTSRVSTVTA